MIKILSLCIYLMLFTISDAVPLKLIAGDRSVVKKDGVTHTISKYYVVPNDYDPNNVTNTTAASQKTTYSDTMASGSISENISESKATTVNDQQDSEVTVKKTNKNNWGSDLNVGQVTNQPHDSTESTVSMRIGQTPDSGDLGNLQVKPIINPVNTSRVFTDKETDIILNSGEAVQKGSAFFQKKITDWQKQQTVVPNFEDILEDLIFSKFGIAVHETYSQNLDSFWKLIKINIDKQLSEDVLLANIEKLSLLLNIFTNLYQVVQLQQPVEKIIEAIVEILTTPFVEKRSGVKSQAETTISGDYDEECMSKCSQRSFKPQLNSKGTVLSETKGGKASDSLELEHLDRKDIAVSGDTNLVKISEDPYSNPVTVSNEPSYVLQRQLQVPYNLNMGVPDGYNILGLTKTSTLNDVARHNVIQQDPSSSQKILNSIESVNNLNVQPVTVKSKFADVLPITIKPSATVDFPWTIDDSKTEPPSTTLTTPNDGLSWHIEDNKSNTQFPVTIEQKTTNKVPWETVTKNLNVQPVTVESRLTGVVPLKTIENFPWTIDDNKTEFPSTNLTTQNDGLPWHIKEYKSNTQLPVTIEQRTNNKVPLNIVSKNLNDQPATVESRFTDVVPLTLQPRTTDDLPWTIDDDKTEFPSTNLTTENDGLPWHIDEYKSNTRLPVTIEQRTNNKLPWNIVSKTDHQPIKTTVFGVKNGIKKPYHIYTYVINPTTTLYKVPNAGNVVHHENLETTLYGLPSLHGANKIVYKDQPPQSYYESTKDISRQPSYSQVKQTNYVTTVLDTNHEVSPSPIDSRTLQEDNELQYLVRQGSETNHEPAVLQSNTRESISVPEIDSPPGDLLVNGSSNLFEFISSSASSSAYTNRLEGSVYEGQIYDNNVPILVDKGDTNNYSGYISKASAHSEYANVPIDYEHNINTQHDPISEVKQYPINPNVVNDLNDSILVDGVQTQKIPKYISEASAHSELTIPVRYNVPTQHYVNEKDSYPVKIQNELNNPEYINEVNRYIKVKAVNGHPAQNVVNYLVPYLPTQNGDKYLLPYQPTQNEDNYYLVPNQPTQNVDNYLVPNQPTQDVKKHLVPQHPTRNEDKYLGPYQRYGHKIHVINRPSLNEIISGNQNLKQKLAPTYRLFTLQNLQNLKNAVMKTLEIYGAGVYDHRALINLKNIINVILVFAENLEGTELTNAWYEKIFYKSEHSQQPLQLYVYNLMRQRWLHELMLLLYRNNFSINIFVQNPRIFSFLESWQFPEYVKNFVEVAGELKHVQKPQNDISYNQNDLQYKVSRQTYDYLLKEVPVDFGQYDFGKYVTKNVIDSYKTPNEDIVLSIGSVKAEPDANAIVEIVQYYLHNKNIIETQENVNIDDNKVEMLKEIISFLRMKGYRQSIIADLIRKLYAAVYSTEGTGCQSQNSNFAKNMYDVIVPVLRRSGQ